MPARALPGARVAITGAGLPLPADGLPHVLIGEQDARVVAASSHTIRVIVPSDAPGGLLPVRIAGVDGQVGCVSVGQSVATDVHQVDSPVFDADGRLYLTQSGTRDARPSVPLMRVLPNGVKEMLSLDIGNPTSMAVGPDGHVYVSSRFDGHVYRLLDSDRVERYATEMGVATGLAFSPEGDLFVGDRSGTIFRVHPDRQVETYATLPPSVAAFHLAFGPDQCLYVTAPTLATHDTLYRITPDRLVDPVVESFGRPQGLAFDRQGLLYVVDALAGAAGLYCVDVTVEQPIPELVVSAAALIGVAFDRTGRVALVSSDTVWMLDGMLDAPIRTVESA